MKINLIIYSYFLQGGPLRRLPKSVRSPSPPKSGRREPTKPLRRGSVERPEAKSGGRHRSKATFHRRERPGLPVCRAGEERKPWYTPPFVPLVRTGPSP